MNASLKYLKGYPEDIQSQASRLLMANKLGPLLLRKYPESHTIRTDAALYDFVAALKNRFLRNATRLTKVNYDNQIKVLEQALGQHHFVSRNHGGKLKSHNAIKIASLFREAPEAFLRMIAVHELAHFKEKEHNKAFYNLCCHMEPQYHQIELDLRLYLLHCDEYGKLY